MHFSETDLPTPFFTYEHQKEIIEDKMGGGDGYRSVAYFVNVSVLGPLFSFPVSFLFLVAALDERGRGWSKSRDFQTPHIENLLKGFISMKF